MIIHNANYQREKPFLIEFIVVYNVKTKPKQVLIKKNDDFVDLPANKIVYQSEYSKLILKNISIGILEFGEGTLIQVVQE